MKKFLGELLASILIVVMTVGSLPNMSYADELLVSPDAYYSETEEGPDETELIEENLEETDEELPEEISEEGEEESLPVEEISEEESVAEGELPEETLDEVILSDEIIEESFSDEAENAVNPEAPIFWITNKNKLAGNEYSLSKYTIKNGDALTLSVVPKWENIGETKPDDIPVTYTWYITDCYTGEKQKVEGNNTDSYILPTDLANNNEYHIDCEASAEYNSKTYDFEFSFGYISMMRVLIPGSTGCYLSHMAKKKICQIIICHGTKRTIFLPCQVHILNYRIICYCLRTRLLLSKKVPQTIFTVE